VLALRERLRTIYARPLTAADMRSAKEREISAFRERYATLRDERWKGDTRYDRWVAAPINNASLLPFGLYDRWIPAFAAVFEKSGSQWPAFFEAVRRLSRLPKSERECRLTALASTLPTGQAESVACREARI